MSDRKQRAGLRRALALREEFRASGEFTTDSYEAKLRAELAKPEYQEEAFDGYVRHIADVVDRQATRERSDDHPFLPGVDWDLEGEYRLGKGRRIAKAKARIEHLDEMLSNDEHNLASVLSASARKHDEVARLRPYMKKGVTKEQAVAKYQADHPRSEAGD